MPGSQKLSGDLGDLKYGVSITDGCIGWEETEALLMDAHQKLSATNAAAVPA
jgi:3-deoxy-7-phosphoheptulonate synthase